jgi:hypothetical protein
MHFREGPGVGGCFSQRPPAAVHAHPVPIRFLRSLPSVGKTPSREIRGVFSRISVFLSENKRSLFAKDPAVPDISGRGQGVGGCFSQPPPAAVHAHPVPIRFLRSLRSVGKTPSREIRGVFSRISVFLSENKRSLFAKDRNPRLFSQNCRSPCSAVPDGCANFQSE